MKNQIKQTLQGAVVLSALAATAFAPSTGLAEGLVTGVKPYSLAYSTDYVVKPIFSVGETIQRTTDASQQFQLVGIPDGMGAHQLPGGRVALFMNHEFVANAQSKPIVGGPTYVGAIVSRIVLSKEANVLSGDIAYDVVVDRELDQTFPVATVENGRKGFGRFCSGSLAWKEAGFDRPFYFCGEESDTQPPFGSPAAVYDGKGGLGVVIFDRQLHTMPWIGRFAWENTLVRPDAGKYTVLMGMEDGPNTTDNQLYMWVGVKDKKASEPLAKNGMARQSGKLYVLIPDDPTQISEAVVTSGSFNAHWVAIDNAEALTDVELEAASDALGAFGFVRIEDGAFDKKDANTFYFVTTGSGAVNVLGRLYKVELNKHNPAGPCKLTVIYNADTIVAAGGDIAISPDNIDTSRDYIMINEDGTSQSRTVMASKGRDGQIWRLDIKNNFAATPVVELNPRGTVQGATPVTVPGLPGNYPATPVVGPGVWETTGIIDASEFYGKDTWLFNTQAHGPSLAPAPFTVEDGQLLIMMPCRNGEGRGNDHDDDDDKGKGKK